MPWLGKDQAPEHYDIARRPIGFGHQTLHLQTQFAQFKKISKTLHNFILPTQGIDEVIVRAHANQQIP